MPIYDFHCRDKKCDLYFERIVPSGIEEEKCPQCAGPSDRVHLAPGSKLRMKFLFNYLERN